MDIGASNWNENDTNNNQPAPDGAPEGMFPSGVNDTIRAVMGALKRWFNWSSARITGGSATAYTLTYGVAPGALVDGMTHLVQFHASNGPGATLNVNNLGAKPLYAYSAGAWYQAPPALFDVATVCRVVYDAGSGAYRLLMPGAVPTGTIVPFAGAAAPVGYLLAFGQAVSRTNYPGLFAVINTTYGIGDNSTTFNVPDLRGCVAAGRDNMGGANRTLLSSVMNSTTLGQTGGQQTESANVTSTGIITATIISTCISMDGPSTGTNSQPGIGELHAGPNHIHANLVSSGVLNTGISVNGNTAAVTNVQPTFIVNQIIKL